METKVTVITAVWHQQKDKQTLLRSHMENLQRQTAPFRVVYVFDCGDSPPDWLAGTKISVSDPLTIYQAWNVALSQVMTPLVMNLNVDDRLSPDAIAIMSEPFESDPEVFLVGGDWKVCFGPGEADDVRQAYPAARLPFYPEWPPASGRETRLGCGVGTQTTYGPACMWRMEAHRRLPRYPHRFADGSLIQIIGDAVWWHAIEHHMRKKLVRLPLIIGHYTSSPATQAEFRHSAAAEHGNHEISLL